MSLNPGTQNMENPGNSAKTLRLIFQALDVKNFAPDSIGKTRLFRTGPRFTQSHLPPHHPNSSMFSPIPPAPTETHDPAAHSPRATRMEATEHDCPNGSRAEGGSRSIAVQCSRQNPTFYGLPSQHCSIDLKLSLARGPHQQLSTVAPTATERKAVVPKTCKARVTVESQSRTRKAYFPAFSPRHCYRVGRHFHHKKNTFRPAKYTPPPAAPLGSIHQLLPTEFRNHKSAISNLQFSQSPARS